MFLDGGNVLYNLGQNLVGSLGDIGPSSFIVWLPCFYSNDVLIYTTASLLGGLPPVYF